MKISHQYLVKEGLAGGVFYFCLPSVIGNCHSGDGADVQSRQLPPFYDLHSDLHSWNKMTNQHQHGDGHNGGCHGDGDDDNDMMNWCRW